MKRLTILLIVLFTLVSGINEIAYAHRAVFCSNMGDMENAVLIDDPLVSHAVYGTIDDEKHVDFIKFNAREGDPLYIEVSVPMVEGSKDFKPSFALISKDLPSSKETLPFSVPEGWGYMAFNESIGGDEYFEPLTQTYYIRRQRVQLLAPATGEYYISVYSPENKAGKYSLVIGQMEKFQLMDVISFPYIWFKIKYWFNPVKAVSTLIVLLVAILGIIYYIRRKR